MKRTDDSTFRVDRRTTIKWLATTMMAAGCTATGRYMGDEIPPNRSVNALLGDARLAGGSGYGTDPDLASPVVPWPRTLNDAQLDASAALCDHILPADERSPAASTLGVHEYIDEWVSAPYPQQQADRGIILDGLEWLEQVSRDRFGRSFVDVTAPQANEILDTVAAPQSAAAGAEFFDRFRFLAVGAYYTTAAGSKDLGYIGNVPLVGAYPGPSEEALAHLAGVLDQLGLQMPG